MKVISYSIFGQEQLYRVGLLKNIEIAKKLFPDWKVFIHLDVDNEKKDFLKNIRQPNTELIDLKEDDPRDGMMWRMLPMEQNHEAVIIRDVDTRLFGRDRKLVDNWMDTNFKFHLCRDNFGSYQTVLGGLWGGRYSNLQIKDNWNKWKKAEFKKGVSRLRDIDFIKKYIYPEIRTDLLVFSEHTIYLGEKNIIKLGSREKYNGRSITLGMVIKEDIQETDNKIEGNRNKQRLEEYSVYEISEDKNDKLIRILFPKHYFKNPILNSLYLLITFSYFLIDYKEYNTFGYVKQKILRYVFRKKVEHTGSNDHIRLWI